MEKLKSIIRETDMAYVDKAPKHIHTQTHKAASMKHPPKYERYTGNIIRIHLVKMAPAAAAIDTS